MAAARKGPPVPDDEEEDVPPIEEEPAAGPPAPDEEEPAAAEAGAPEEGGDELGEGGESEAPDVVATILCNPDGSYRLLMGDESETGGEEGAGVEPDQGGATFTNVGALLKGVLEAVKTYDASKSGEGSEEDNFQAGYEGGSEAGAGAKPGAMPSAAMPPAMPPALARRPGTVAV